MSSKAVISVMSIAVLALLCACAPKPTDTLKQAEEAIAEAEAAGAGEKAPVALQKARANLAEGKSQESQLRYNLARAEYQAAIDNAEIAKIMAQAPQPEMPPQECPECPEETGSCCLELDMANKQIDKIKGRLERCRSSKSVVTRVIETECPEPDCPPATGGGDFLGTLTVEPPEGLKQGKTDYGIKVTYTPHRLSDGALEEDYRILVDVASVEPPGIEVFSPMADYEKLTGNPDSWTLKMTVPEGHQGDIKVGISATIWHAGTAGEKKLPVMTVVVPDASACPDCPKCPPPAEEKADNGGGDWGMRIILLLVGLVIGIGGGFLVFGRKSA